MPDVSPSCPRLSGTFFSPWNQPCRTALPGAIEGIQWILIISIQNNVFRKFACKVSEFLSFQIVVVAIPTTPSSRLRGMARWSTWFSSCMPTGTMHGLVRHRLMYIWWYRSIHCKKDHSASSISSINWKRIIHAGLASLQSWKWMHWAIDKGTKFLLYYSQQ